MAWPEGGVVSSPVTEEDFISAAEALSPEAFAAARTDGSPSLAEVLSPEASAAAGMDGLPGLAELFSFVEFAAG